MLIKLLPNLNIIYTEYLILTLTVTYLRRNLLFSLCALACQAHHAMQQMLISCVLSLCPGCPGCPVL